MRTRARSPRRPMEVNDAPKPHDTEPGWRVNPTQPPAILVATVDTLPEPYQVLGMVDAVLTGAPGTVPTARLMDMLANEAVAMGADGVIGIRLTQVALPVASQAGPLGRVTDHYANSVMTTALGTAIRVGS